MVLDCESRQLNRCMTRPDRIEILGTPVDVVDGESCVVIVDSCIDQGKNCFIVAVNPEKIVRARKNKALFNALCASTILIPDGIGVVIAARLLGLADMKRLAGADLMVRLCAHAARKGYGVFLLGASEDVNQRASEALLRQYPTLNIVGRQHGYISDEDMPTIVEGVQRSGAQILFLALGTPKQEILLHRYFMEAGVPVCQCVGGTLDVLAGRVDRAPAIFRRLGLEWAYRLMRQPSRALRQRALLVFVVEALRAWLLGLYRRVVG